MVKQNRDDHDDDVIMVMIKCSDLEKHGREKQKAQGKGEIDRSFSV